MTRQSPLVKVAIGLAVLAGVAFLFWQSVRSTRAEPFTVERQGLSGWTLVQQPPQDSQGSWLAVSPPARLARLLGRDIFERGGESVNYPNPPLMPLLLQSEFDRAFAGKVPPDDIVNLARAAAFESATWVPRCMGYRRLSEGRPRALYFMLLDSTAFDRFRQQLAEMLQKAGGNATLFDPAALSPALIVAGLDSEFGRWMPLRADPATECLAPIDVT